MPRRPVKPEDRQRVARACNQCKAAKKRCNGNQPCDACVKKSNPETCHYTRGRRRYPLPSQSSFTSHDAPPIDSSSNGNGLPANKALLSPMSSSNHYADSTRSPGSISSNEVYVDVGHGTDHVTDDETHTPSSEDTNQPPLMLSSVNGEKEPVFVGTTAAISFLGFLQKTLERHIGPSGFTIADDSHKLFEADAEVVDPDSVYDYLSIEDKQMHIQVFLDASSGFLDLFCRDDINRLLGNHEPISPSRIPDAPQRLCSLETASLYLMIAIGAQCSQSKANRKWSWTFFAYARKLAMEGMLADPSLDLVRVFLLMAFYMFGACRRNSAFMYLGVASKAADILGLHSSAQYKHLSEEARNARLRTAKSLRVFDIICNSILGRRSSTPAIRADHTSYLTESSADPEAAHKALALGASYEISSILNEAVTRSNEVGLDLQATEAFVLALQKQSRTFPPILRKHDSQKDPTTRHIIIGNVHVSGSYYFSVILITRHCLIRHVIPLLSGKGQYPSQQDGNTTTRTPENTEVAHLADACIEAALLMAQMCHQVMKSGLLVSNMCILKAWVFATGLVLGFSLLVADSRAFPRKRAAFLQSLHVLGELKRTSPQAEQYYNILMSFHQTIKSYQEQMNRGGEEARPALVDRIFLTDFVTDLDDAEHIATQVQSPEAMEPEPLTAEWPLDIHNVWSISKDAEPIDPVLMGENDVIMRMLWDVDKYADTYIDPLLPDLDMGFECTTGMAGPVV